MCEKPVVKVKTLFVNVGGKESHLTDFAIIPTKIDPDSVELIEHRTDTGASRHIVATVAEGMPHAGAVVSTGIAYTRLNGDEEWVDCVQDDWMLWHTEDQRGPRVGQFIVIG